MKKAALNPFLPLDTYIPDGEPHVFGDRVYLFGSHDQEGGDTFCMLGYEIWSAPINDLSHWSTKGISYRAEQDPLYEDTMRYMYAPDCVQGNDGRFYLYYCMAGERGRGGYSNPISVAVCDTPDGKYEYLGVVKNPDGTPLLRHLCFDPAVINDSGTIRLYFGTNYPWFDRMPFHRMRERAIMIMSGKSREQLRAVPEGVMGAYHVTLADDMRTVASVPVRIDNTIAGKDYAAHGFFEGSSIRKVGGTYYFIYSSINNHELCYATSDCPDGGYVYGGTIVSNGDIGYGGRKPKDRLNHTGTNHGSIERINGAWYVFYHRLTHNSDYSRQACAERIEVEPDGSIPQIEITSCGLNGAPLQYGAYPAVCCCNLTNGHMKHGSNSNRRSNEPCVTHGDDERFITGIQSGTKIVWKHFDLSGTVRLTVTIRGTGTGRFSVETREGTEAASISVKPSEQWADAGCVFTVQKGIYPLYLIYRGSGSVELIRIKIEKE